MRLHVGTSGYSYKEWKGKFYPSDLPAAKMLNYYDKHFSAVEINSTFRALPKASVLQGWVSEVSPKFKFCLKAPQQITHVRRLDDVRQPLRSLLDLAGELGDHMGPLLFQLPPNFKKNLDRLREFLGLVSSEWRMAMEFRHQSWLEDDVFDVLRDHNAALCISDEVEGLEVPFLPTADWGYLRLRRCRYTAAQLKQTLKRIQQQDWRDAFVFFKHEDQATGPTLATELLELTK